MSRSLVTQTSQVIYWSLAPRELETVFGTYPQLHQQQGRGSDRCVRLKMMTQARQVAAATHLDLLEWFDNVDGFGKLAKSHVPDARGLNIAHRPYWN